MAISKKFLKTKPVCKVRFEVPKDEVKSEEAIFIVGDFNGWDEESSQLKRLKSGKHTITLDLEVGQEYQFRYRTENNVWFNDGDADRYEGTHFADVENSVIIL